MSRPLLAAVIFLCFSVAVSAQKSFDQWWKEKEGFRIEPFVMLQLWSSYSMGQEVYNKESNRYEPVDDRFNLLLRRARLGFRMQPYDNLKFTLLGAYDMIGRDVNTALLGSTNNGSLPAFGIWDAFLEWRLKPGSEAMHIVAGYFRPQFSRESITSGWATTSFEKAMSQNYIRKHLVGTGPGRALGINLGGLFLTDNKKLGLNYNIGVFNPVYMANDGNSTGADFSPLLVGRAVVYLGDPEMKTYKIGYDINYFGQRKGLSIGLGGSWQGSTALFRKSYSAEVDYLLNWGPLNIDGEWNFMWRDGSRPSGNNGPRSFTYYAGTGHARIGYNLVAGKLFLEPTFMAMRFNGATDAEGQADAKAIGASSGKDFTYDAGLNWYLNKTRLKLALHYTWNEGDAGAGGAGFTGNAYFSQPGVGAIRRGNWIGLGLGAIF